MATGGNTCSLAAPIEVILNFQHYVDHKYVKIFCACTYSLRLLVHVQKIQHQRLPAPFPAQKCSNILTLPHDYNFPLFIQISRPFGGMIASQCHATFFGISMALRKDHDLFAKISHQWYSLIFLQFHKIAKDAAVQLHFGTFGDKFQLRSSICWSRAQ